MRKIIAVTVILMLLSGFSACNTASVPETTTEHGTEDTQAMVSTESTETTAYYEETAVPETTAAPDTTAAPETTTAEAVTEAVVTEPDTTEAVTADAASLSTEEVIEFYKNAASLTGNSVQSSQTVGLQDISVNNGQLGGVFSFVTPILSSFLSSSATVTDGVTGDYSRLTAEDVSSARAYEGSKGTVVEITLNEQTDTGEADRGEGSVAHGISVVGDLLSIMGQLKEKGLPIDISMENTVIKYTNPVIKAVISEDGKIINGTWSCVVEISLSDYKFAGSTVDSTRVVLDNTITVNGGFSA